MVGSSALAALGLEIGVVLAKKIGAILAAGPKADERLKRVEAIIGTGVTAVAAFQKTFGKEFYEAISSAVSSKEPAWTHEAARADYIRIDAVEGRAMSARQMLRDELNINLDRIARTYGDKGADIQGYFLGVFREWMTRYRDHLGEDSDAQQTFQVIESLLDGRRKTFADAFRLLQRTGLGVIGALLVLQAVLVATSTGVGVAAAISVWLWGIPMAQVGALAVGGALLLALSRVKFGPANGMSTSVAAAYRLLDRGERSGVANGQGSGSVTEKPKP